jgi:diguanylate cyclase (GGDEF)-like protein
MLETAGHVVTALVDPREALARVKADEAIDAVIAAAELTPMTGVELCSEVRLLAGEHRPIYVALMSSTIDGRTVIEALDVGADDLIQKPPKKQEIHARLRSAERLLTLQRKLIRLATIDSLTGLLNRRAFFERATKICAQAPNTGSVSAILLDIDYFKEVNDLYGHSTGDEALRVVAGEVGRGQPLVGRLGGDELCVLLNGCTEVEALAAAERIRAGIAGLSVKTAKGKTSLTCSLGVSELAPEGDIDGLIRNADLALYRAKLEGRDRAATPPSPVWLEENPLKASRVARAVKRQHAA